MQKYYELIRRYQQPQFKYNQPLGATTPMANQNLMENYADIMKRLNELYSAKYLSLIHICVLGRVHKTQVT